MDTANKLINSKADFDEWKQKFKDMSAIGSIVPSLYQSPIHSCDYVTPQILTEEEHSDVEMDD